MIWVLNAVINNFNHLDLRTDVGALWENFLITERMKYNNNASKTLNTYFWRTYDKKEIDYIEEANGKLSAFEFKYSSDKYKKPSEFLETYTGSKFKLINKDNFLAFIS